MNILNFAIDMPVLLRLFSALWSVIIVFIIALIFKDQGGAALAQFFSVSLIGVVSGGFSSFTLARQEATKPQLSVLLAIFTSSAAMFACIEFFVISGPLDQRHTIIVSGFLFRELLSYWLRQEGQAVRAVIVREHVWRMVLITSILLSSMLTSQAVLLDLFAISTMVAFVGEIALFDFGIRLIRFIRTSIVKNCDSRTSFLKNLTLDFSGKLQSLSIAFIPITITSNENLFAANIITFFVLVERSSRPLGLIISQGILDFQRQGKGIVRAGPFFQKFISKRKHQLLLGAILYFCTLVLFAKTYSVEVSFIAALATVSFHTYILFYNILNSYVVLNLSPWVVFLRATILLITTAILVYTLHPSYVLLLGFLIFVSLLQDRILIGFRLKRKIGNEQSW